MPEHERYASWHLVAADGEVSSRGAAGIELVRALGQQRTAAVSARLAAPIERLYDMVAEHRDTLGRFVPDGPAPRRYP